MTRYALSVLFMEIFLIVEVLWGGITNAKNGLGGKQFSILEQSLEGIYKHVHARCVLYKTSLIMCVVCVVARRLCETLNLARI